MANVNSLLAILLLLGICLLVAPALIVADSDYYSLSDAAYEEVRKWAVANGARIHRLKWPVGSVPFDCANPNDAGPWRTNRKYHSH